MPYILNIFN